MTDNLRESISALMDNEANELELHRLLSSMEQSDEVRNTWKRYQLASFAMKRNLPKNLNIDISAQVAQAIADEDIEIETGGMIKQAGWNRLIKPLTSVAVAASVAFVVVFGALQVNQSGSVTGVVKQDSTELNTLAIGGNPGVKDVMPVSDEALTPSQKKLKALIDTHTQQVDLSRGRAFMPYAQLVSDSESQRY
ncbi:MAG: sigma-E factor negative regulatory protein [Pseudomonadales bacterium]|nr:sigma-E factor negative regulatory protein [Pseudomonadales bacterium]